MFRLLDDYPRPPEALYPGRLTEVSSIGDGAVGCVRLFQIHNVAKIPIKTATPNPRSNQSRFVLGDRFRRRRDFSAAVSALADGCSAFIAVWSRGTFRVRNTVFRHGGIA